MDRDDSQYYPDIDTFGENQREIFVEALNFRLRVGDEANDKLK